MKPLTLFLAVALSSSVSFAQSDKPPAEETAFKLSLTVKVTGAVHGALLAGDKEILSSADGMVKVWSTESGKELQTIETQPKSVISIALSPDGSIAATSTSDNKVRLWDTKTWKEKCSLEGHKDGVCCLAFSSDGTRLVSGSYDREVRVWNSATGKHEASFTGEDKFGLSFAVPSPDMKIVATGGSGEVAIQTLDGGIEKEIRGRADAPPVGAAFSPDGKRLAVAFPDFVFMYETSDWAVRGRFTGVGACVAFSPDGATLATPAAGKGIHLVTVADRKDDGTPIPCDGTVSSLHFSSDGKRLIAGCGDGTIRIFQKK